MMLEALNLLEFSFSFLPDSVLLFVVLVRVLSVVLSVVLSGVPSEVLVEVSFLSLQVVCKKRSLSHSTGTHPHHLR